jgi:3-oxoacyl-[acyl-carrier protein] reductase
LAKFGKIDILINNAGGPPPGSFLEQSEAAWEAAINQNLMSAIRFCTLAAPIMKQNNWGRIISILSSVAKEPSKEMVLSATTRAGLSAFTKSIALDLAPYQITVNSILPGGVLTDRLYSLLSKGIQTNSEDMESKIKESAKIIPIQRHATPKEIADVVLFLASQEASYVTGLNIPVDGGLTRGVF